MQDIAKQERFNGGAVFMAAVRLLMGNAIPLIGFAALANLALAVVSIGISLLLTGSVNGPGGIIEYIFGPLIFAMLVLRSSDALAGAQRPLVEQLRQVLAPAFVLILTSIAASILTGIGLILLIVPGLYAAAVLLPMTSLILFENAGRDVLERSYKLAKPYAWPIVGVLLRITFVGLIVIVPLFMMLYNDDGSGGVLVTLISVLGGAALTALYAVAGYMIYLRLRDLSGTGGDVSNVFR